MMERVWKAFIGMILIFILLLYGFSMINSLPSYLSLDIFLFLLFVIMATIIVWMWN